MYEFGIVLMEKDKVTFWHAIYDSPTTLDLQAVSDYTPKYRHLTFSYAYV